MSVDFGPIQFPTEPVDGVMQWLAEAEASGATEAIAMTLATATKDGRPSARIVYFKGLSASSDGRKGFTFYTNYDSRKSVELKANPRAALVFFWSVTGRQVRVEGRVEKLGAEDSDKYFQSRARGSRVGAWASPQSQKIESRATLLERVKDIESRFKGEEIPRPPHWGGWIVVPERIEFWHSGDSRLHDRFSYEWDGRTWIVARLAP